LNGYFPFYELFISLKSKVNLTIFVSQPSKKEGTIVTIHDLNFAQRQNKQFIANGIQEFDFGI